MKLGVILLAFTTSIFLASCLKNEVEQDRIHTIQNSNVGNNVVGGLRAAWPKRFVFGTKSHPGDCQGGTICCTGDRGICVIIEWLSDETTLEEAIAELDTLQGIVLLDPISLDSMFFTILYDSEAFDPNEQPYLNVNKDFLIPVESEMLTIKQGTYLLNYNGTYIYGRTKIHYKLE